MRAGPALPQWAVPGLTSLHGTGVFLLPSSRFTFEARILALEIYGHTAGDIKVFVSAFALIIFKAIYYSVEFIAAFIIKQQKMIIINKPGARRHETRYGKNCLRKKWLM